MSEALPVSVVVVSHGRPEALARCLTGLTQLAYSQFEIVVVADKPGLDRLDRMPALFRTIKRQRFDTANISHARNLGIAQAAGEIVAFIDDDAVAEPLWLDHLVAPFGDPRVMSAGGYVLGRNGLSLQWGPRCIGPTGQSEPVEVPGQEACLFSGRPGLGIKTEGTNMAFRRQTLARLGGFDPAFRFYLEEGDLNLRLADEAHAAALVPLARVHHGFLESARRRADRVPRDLTEIGASIAIYLRKHAPPGEHSAAFVEERLQRRRGLLEHMIAGRIEPRDVARILATYDAGFSDGLTRAIDPLVALPDPAEPFAKFDSPQATHPGQVVVHGRPWQSKRVRSLAVQAVRDGRIATAVILSPTSRPHRVSFETDGYWLQSGGLFGPSLRTDPKFRWWRFPRRLAREVSLFEAVRGAERNEVNQG